MTMQGMILGTAAYMAPEQAKGKPLDRRADIWAFGCVLYEMLTGRRTFEGEDVTDTIAAVVTKEPDWSCLPAATPPSVERLLRRCLEKQVSRRLPHIGVARLELSDIPGANSRGPMSRRRERGVARWRQLRWQGSRRRLRPRFLPDGRRFLSRHLRRCGSRERITAVGDRWTSPPPIAPSALRSPETKGRGTCR